jgi:tetratricopeptide (TPR) repeat protein
MGLIYKRENHCDSAIALFQRAIAVRGAYPEARFNSAVCYKSMGDIDKALEQIDAAIRSDSTYVRGLTLKAELLRAAGRGDSALATLHYAHALPGAGPSAARALAEMYRERDNDADALRFYHEYLDAESTDVAALHDAARLERVAGNAQRGLVYMRRAYELDRDDERLALDYGRALSEAKRLNEARRVLARALDQAPDNIDLRTELAAIYEEQGNSRGAGRHYEALGKITGDYDHIIKAADQYLEASRYEQALAQFAKARSLRPGEWRPSYYTSLMQVRLDKFAEARASWRMFADSFPNDSRGYYQLGKLAAEREDWDSAVGYLRQSLELKSYRFAHFYLAQSLYELERYQEAMEHARAFLEADPDSRRGQKLLRAIRGKQKS